MYIINEAHLGGEATVANAQRMVELLCERGYDVTYGYSLEFPDDDPGFDTDWDECLDIISHECYGRQSK
jgi:hypothetical protein